MSAVATPASDYYDANWRHSYSYPLLEEVCGGVIEGPMIDKHVTIGASGVGPFSLLQDHNCVQQVAMRKVNPDIVPAC